MYKYFRTLFNLIRFFLEDEFLYIGYSKDDNYFPIIQATRKLLLNHLLTPFKTTRTFKFDNKYLIPFQKRICMAYNNPSSKKVISVALNEFLFKFGLSLNSDINFDNMSFSYTYC